MGKSYLDVETVGQVPGQTLSAIDRAVLPACAAETHLHIGEFPLYEAFDMGVHQRIDVLKEPGDSPIVLQEFDHFLIKPGKLTVMLVLARVVDCPAIEHESAPVPGSVHRDAFLVCEAEYLDFQALVLGDVIELGHRCQGGQYLIQIRILDERLLEQLAEIAERVRDAGKEMRLLLEIASETIRSQHLKGPEQDEKSQPLIKDRLINFRIAFKGCQVSLG